MADNFIMVTVPLYVELPRKTKKNKKISFSRNVWDTLHHAVRSQAKHIVQNLVAEQLFEYVEPLVGPVSLTVDYYANRTDSDLGNFVDVLKKIVQDAVVTNGLLPDDCVKIIIEEHAYYRGVDKKNPRLEMKWLQI